MAHIHAQGYTHRDLKSANVLLKPTNVLCDRVTSRAKVADFGMARLLYDSDEQLQGRASFSGASLMTSDVGTVQWLAPELCVLRDTVNQKFEAIESQDQEGMRSYREFRDARMRTEYSHKVDVYSFGVLLWEFIAHRAPWSHLDSGETLSEREFDDLVIRCVAQGERLEISQEARACVPEGWCSLLLECQAQDPEDRPSFKAIGARLKILRMGEMGPEVPGADFEGLDLESNTPAERLLQLRVGR
eukprot:TRINITY_DN52915_c0_g1_i1.p1 TRINITY_DN52915_c0_g1~~TRINITY_DN52915_c0_g1_i1.p1  ORF type:complete len:245 (+),score=46.56 TRINITY_DN52915_c0_g1_i1:107-841(+)